MTGRTFNIAVIHCHCPAALADDRVTGVGEIVIDINRPHLLHCSPKLTYRCVLRRKPFDCLDNATGLPRLLIRPICRPEALRLGNQACTALIRVAVDAINGLRQLFEIGAALLVELFGKNVFELGKRGLVELVAILEMPRSSARAMLSSARMFWPCAPIMAKAAAASSLASPVSMGVARLILIGRHQLAYEGQQARGITREVSVAVLHERFDGRTDFKYATSAMSRLMSPLYVVGILREIISHHSERRILLKSDWRV
jgi:hypothetical protein